MNKANIVRSIRNTAISVAVLLVLAVGGGVAYTWFEGRSGTDATTLPSTAKAAAPLVIKHVQPAVNAKVGASFQSLTSPVVPGSNASVAVRTNPGAKCTITVVYDKIASKDSGLSAKTADEFGMVNWAWTVEPSVPLGKWPATVTCSLNKLSAVVQGDLVIAKQAI